jgi:hypothetical protein
MRTRCEKNIAQTLEEIQHILQKNIHSMKIFRVAFLTFAPVFHKKQCAEPP